MSRKLMMADDDPKTTLMACELELAVWLKVGSKLSHREASYEAATGLEACRKRLYALYRARFEAEQR